MKSDMEHLEYTGNNSCLEYKFKRQLVNKTYHTKGCL